MGFLFGVWLLVMVHIRMWVTWVLNQCITIVAHWHAKCEKKKGQQQNYYNEIRRKRICGTETLTEAASALVEEKVNETQCPVPSAMEIYAARKRKVLNVMRRFYFSFAFTVFIPLLVLVFFLPCSSYFFRIWHHFYVAFVSERIHLLLYFSSLSLTLSFVHIYIMQMHALANGVAVSENKPINKTDV